MSEKVFEGIYTILDTSYPEFLKELVDLLEYVNDSYIVNKEYAFIMHEILEWEGKETVILDENRMDLFRSKVKELQKNHFIAFINFREIVEREVFPVGYSSFSIYIKNQYRRRRAAEEITRRLHNEYTERETAIADEKGMLVNSIRRQLEKGISLDNALIAEGFSKKDRERIKLYVKAGFSLDDSIEIVNPIHNLHLKTLGRNIRI